MFTKFWDARTARVLCTIIVFALVLLFLRDARDTLTLFLFAVLFAYFVEPLVGRLELPLRGRARAIAVVYLALIVLLVVFGLLVGPKIADESRSLMQSLPSLFNRLTSGQLVSQVGNNHGVSLAHQQQIQGFFNSHKDDLPKYASAIAAKLEEPLSHIWWLILIPILSLFFLKDGRTMADGIVDMGRTEQEKKTLSGIVTDVNIMLGSYIRAQLILAGLTLVAYTLVLSLMGVPYAFILGPLAGIFEFIPVVGPAVAAAAVFVIAILTGYPHLLLLFLFLGCWRLIQDYVSAPRVLGKTLEIEPLVQIFGVLAGGEIGGVVGALISVPVIAILRILWRRMRSEAGPDAAISPALARENTTKHS